MREGRADRIWMHGKVCAACDTFSGRRCEALGTSPQKCRLVEHIFGSRVPKPSDAWQLADLNAVPVLHR